MQPSRKKGYIAWMQVLIWILLLALRRIIFAKGPLYDVSVRKEVCMLGQERGECAPCTSPTILAGRERVKRKGQRERGTP